MFRKDGRLRVSHFSLLGLVDFRRLLSGQFVSQSADAVTSVVMARAVLFSSADGPTPQLLMQAVVSAAIPLFIGGPIGGFLADRLSRQRLLVCGQVVRSLLVVVVALAMFGNIVPLLLGCFVVLQCLSRILYTARSAAVRHVVRQHELVVADALILITGVIAGVTGVGLAVALMQIHAVVALAVALSMHFAAAYFYDAIRAWMGGDGIASTTRWWFALSQFGCGKTRYSLLATSVHRLGVGVAIASSALWLDDVSGRGASGYAMALAASGLGSFVGSTSAEALNERIPHKNLTVLTYLVAGVAMSVGFVTGSSVSVVIGLGVAAAAFQVLRIASDATIQANALKGSCGRVFAVYDIVFNSSFLVGLLVGLQVSQDIGPGAVLISLVPFFVIGGVAFSVMRRSPAAFSDTRGSGHPTTRNRRLARPSL